MRKIGDAHIGTGKAPETRFWQRRASSFGICDEKDAEIARLKAEIAKAKQGGRVAGDDTGRLSCFMIAMIFMTAMMQKILHERADILPALVLNTVQVV